MNKKYWKRRELEDCTKTQKKKKKQMKKRSNRMVHGGTKEMLKLNKSTLLASRFVCCVRLRVFVCVSRVQNLKTNDGNASKHRSYLYRENEA